MESESRQFVIRRHSDGCLDCICLRCFRTVATAATEAELETPRQDHRCEINLSGETGGHTHQKSRKRNILILPRERESKPGRDIW